MLLGSEAVVAFQGEQCRNMTGIKKKKKNNYYNFHNIMTTAALTASHLNRDKKLLSSMFTQP